MCDRERVRERESERKGEKEIDSREREKVNIIYTVCAPYSVYMYISCTPCQTIVRKREREGESFVVVVALKKAS